MNLLETSRVLCFTIHKHGLGRPIYAGTPIVPMIVQFHPRPNFLDSNLDCSRSMGTEQLQCFGNGAIFWDSNGNGAMFCFCPHGNSFNLLCCPASFYHFEQQQHPCMLSEKTCYSMFRLVLQLIMGCHSGQKSTFIL